MTDKTRLELDLEHQERYKTPLGVRILIVLLIMGLCAAGAYIFRLHQALSQKEQEIVALRNNFQNEKTALLGKIRRLETEQSSSSPELAPE